MVYYTPYITGQYNPLYTLSNQGFFIAHLIFYTMKFLLIRNPGFDPDIVVIR